EIDAALVRAREDHVAVSRDRDPQSLLLRGIAELLAPQMVAVRIELQYEGVAAAEVGDRAGAEVGRPVERAHHHEVGVLVERHARRPQTDRSREALAE